MANNNIVTEESKIVFPSTYSRMNGQPLDDSMVFNSLGAAEMYAASAKAYAGQIIAVKHSIYDPIDKKSFDKYVAYVITNTSGTLKEIGSEALYSKASGNYAHAEGSGTEALGQFSHTEGYDTKASDYAHAEGNLTRAYGSYSHCEGNSTMAFGSGAHAAGYGKANNWTYEALELQDIKNNISFESMPNLAYGNYSHTEGACNIAYGEGAHAEGSYTKADGNYSHAEGYLTEAYGEGAHAEGYSTNFIGGSLHLPSIASITGLLDGVSAPEGTNKSTSWNSDKFALAYGKASHIEGRDCIAYGDKAHAEGQETLAVGENSHAEGYKTNASGNYSHTEGQETIASATAAHAEGYETQATGLYSHAEGCYTEAKHNSSHASGEGTRTSRSNQTVVGLYNTDNTNALFIVGNGSTLAVRSNAFEVLTNGTAEATSFNAKSDARLKKNIVDYTPANSILDLPVKEFDYINTDLHTIGCLAQDLQKICPELVSEDSKGYLSIAENKLVYLLLLEVKKLKEEIKELKG